MKPREGQGCGREMVSWLQLPPGFNSTLGAPEPDSRDTPPSYLPSLLCFSRRQVQWCAPSNPKSGHFIFTGLWTDPAGIERATQHGCPMPQQRKRGRDHVSPSPGLPVPALTPQATDVPCKQPLLSSQTVKGPPEGQAKERLKQLSLLHVTAPQNQALAPGEQ